MAERIYGVNGILAVRVQTNYEVVFGPAEADRQLYIDYGDGTWLSTDAKVRANRFFFELSIKRVPCGFWVNGRLVAGEDTATVDEPILDPGYFRLLPGRYRLPLEHKTRTFRLTYERTLNWRTERYQEDPWSKAVCSCGWSAYGDDRADARRRARAHREETDA